MAGRTEAHWFETPLSRIHCQPSAWTLKVAEAEMLTSMWRSAVRRAARASRPQADDSNDRRFERCAVQTAQGGLNRAPAGPHTLRTTSTSGVKGSLQVICSALEPGPWCAASFL